MQLNGISRLVVLVAGSLLLLENARAESPVVRPGGAESRRTDALSTPADLRLASYQESEKTTVKTTVTTIAEDDWEISGPVTLRAATPEPPGEVVIKNIFGWEHEKEADEGDDRDEYEYELEVEWGVVENHELIFELPFQIGDGEVDGNGDLTVGWHWRLWKEEGNWPAFALRNFVRLPSGSNSNGVDYELRALITKTITPGSTRLHVNPFAKSVNGDNEEDAEPFQYGAAVGIDHRLADNLLFITDYVYSSEDTDDAIRGNHAAEFGLDWEFAEHQKLGASFLVGLDGDSDGAEYGAAISYMYSFGG